MGIGKKKKVGEEKMMNRVELKSCYVCAKPVFPEDKTAKKRINGIDSTRHLWHRIPNSGTYFHYLADAKEFCTKLISRYNNDSTDYVVLESREILEDIERLEKIGV